MRTTEHSPRKRPPGPVVGRAFPRLVRPGLALWAAFALSAAGPSAAQPAISVDGVVESRAGGFRFPDGSVQSSAASPGFAPVAETGQDLCYDPSGASSDAVPCAGTGQDGDGRPGVEWPVDRFVDNGDGTVTDHLTGLIWLRDADCATFLAPISFDQALAEADALADGTCGLTDGSTAGDWRVPNVRELASLLDYGELDPALPSGHPFTQVELDFYHSSTSFQGATENSWQVFLGTGEDRNRSKDSTTAFLWPVRGGR
ncbi:MAG: DUF1566 domain-containing protein [Thermoanaerobaculia bacterium]